MTTTKTWLTIPNIVTAVRLAVFMPIITALLAVHAAAWVTVATLIVFAATDWVDGLLARRLGQVSCVGEILDPIADRVGLIVICVAMSMTGYLPVWAPVVIIATDLVVGLTGMLIPQSARGLNVSRVGKVRTTLLMAALPLLIVGLPASSTLIAFVDLTGMAALIAGCALHVVAGVLYMRSMIRAAVRGKHRVAALPERHT